MSKILVIAEHDGSKLNPATAKCVACASAIPGADITVLVLAASAGAVAAQAASIAASNVSSLSRVRRSRRRWPP